MQRNTLLAFAAVTAIIAVSVVLNPMTRTQTGGRQIEKAETGSVITFERDSHACGRVSEKEIQSFRINLPEKVLAEGLDASVVSGNEARMVPVSVESCYAWTSLIELARPSTCTTACRAGSCVLTVYPRGILTEGKARMEILSRGNGAVIAAADYKLDSSESRILPTTAVLDGRTLRIARGTAPSDESLAFVRFLPGSDAPESIEFTDGKAEVTAPDWATAYEIAIRSRSGGLESTEVLRGDIGRDCAGRG